MNPLPTSNLPQDNVVTVEFGRAARLEALGVLPVGQLVSYEDMANPFKKYVVISEELGNIGEQQCVGEDGEVTQVIGAGIYGGTSQVGWKIFRDHAGTPVVLDAEERDEFLAAAEKAKQELQAEEAEAAKEDAASRVQETARLKAEYPYLTLQATSPKRGHVLAAANIRKVLARHFPGVKFSVTSSAFSMGNRVTVSWVDGPTMESVDSLVGKFETGSFDGMEDIYRYSNAVFPELFGGAKYVHTSRKMSAAAYELAIGELGYSSDVRVDCDGYLSGGTREQIEQVKRAAHAKEYPRSSGSGASTGVPVAT